MNHVHWFPTQTWLDEQAFEGIFLEYYPRIYTVIFRLVGDRYEADDLTADTFWRLWKNPPTQNENLAGWLYRVATRLGYNAMRAAKRRIAYENRAGQDNLESQTIRDPEQATEQSYERQRVREILRQMPLRDVQILILRHSGLSYKEIAAAAGISPSSVGSLLTRAEEKFEKLYTRGGKDASQG